MNSGASFGKVKLAISHLNFLFSTANRDIVHKRQWAPTADVSAFLMPTNMTDPLSLPQSGEEALQQLLARGLSQDSPDDPNSYCKLLQVLFEHCILKPISDSAFPSPTITEQVRLTLTILQRQTTARPELLSCSTTSADPGVPLYKWVLPRLMYAAYMYEEAKYKRDDAEDGMDLADDLLLAVSEVVTVLCRDLDNDAGTSYAKGNVKAVLALRTLRSYCESTLMSSRVWLIPGLASQKPSDLFGYTKLPTSNLSLLLALQVIFRTHIFFADDITADASAMLATVAHSIKSSTPKRQTRFARTLTYALQSDVYAPILRNACIVVSKWPDDTTFQPWQNAMFKLNQAMLRGDVDLRADVWWTLFEIVDQHDAKRLIGGSRIEHLATMIPSRIPCELVSELVLQRIPAWAEQLEDDRSLRKQVICTKLAQYIDAESPPSKKRKRDPEKVDEAFRILKKEFPDMKLADSKDILPGLAGLIKRYANFTSALQTLTHSTSNSGTGSAGTQISPIISIISRIFPAIMDADDVLREYLPGALYLWKTLYDKHGAEIEVMQLVVTMFERADPAELATQLQLQERKPVVNCLWEAFVAEDRKKRIMAGCVMLRSSSTSYCTYDQTSHCLDLQSPSESPCSENSGEQP